MPNKYQEVEREVDEHGHMRQAVCTASAIKGPLSVPIVNQVEVLGFGMVDGGSPSPYEVGLIQSFHEVPQNRK